MIVLERIGFHNHVFDYLFYYLSFCTGCKVLLSLCHSCLDLLIFVCREDAVGWWDMNRLRVKGIHSITSLELMYRYVPTIILSYCHFKPFNDTKIQVCSVESRSVMVHPSRGLHVGLSLVCSLSWSCFSSLFLILSPLCSLHFAVNKNIQMNKKG